MTVTQAADRDTEREPELVRRFGRPSNFSLTKAELTAEVRRRRRDGWQHWEIRQVFDFRRAA